MGKVIGLDLGTNYSAVKSMEAGEPVIIPIAEGGRIIPSVVAMRKGAECLTGQVAKGHPITSTDNTINTIT